MADGMFSHVKRFFLVTIQLNMPLKCHEMPLFYDVGSEIRCLSEKNMSGIKNFEPALAHPVAKATWAFQQFVGASLSISFAMLKETNWSKDYFWEQQ